MSFYNRQRGLQFIGTAVACLRSAVLKGTEVWTWHSVIL